MSNNSQMRALVQQLSSDPNLDPSKRQEAIKKVMALYAEADIDYLNALYFPETSEAARIPSKFGVPSSVFTQKFHYYVNTGPYGTGGIGLLPQDTTFRCSFVIDSLGGPYDPNKLGVGKVTFPDQSDCRYIPDKFSEARLVGASMRVSYIGTSEQESGFVIGSHLFDANPFMLSEEQIEEGHYVSRGRPSQGVRLVYIPKDERDMFFSPTNVKLQVADGHDQFVFQPNDFLMHEGADDANMVDDGANNDGMFVQTLVLTADESATQNIKWGATKINKPPMYFLGQHADKGDSETPNMMVVYFKGLPKNEDWLRVDVERHFEALPRHSLKDFVGVRRPVHNQKTIDFVQSATHTTNLHSNLDENTHAMVAYVKPNVHLIPDNPHLVQGKQTKDHFEKFASIAGGLAGMGAAAYFGQPELMTVAGSAGSALASGIFGAVM